MHRERRREFFDEVIECRNRCGEPILGDCLHDAAIAWGRLTFFVAIGLLLFVWPRIFPVNAATLTGYTLTILYTDVALGADRGLAAILDLGFQRRWRKSTAWA